MSLRESYNALLEHLKFDFYAPEEVKMELSDTSSQTSQPEQQEFHNFSFNPFGSYTSSDFNQQMLFMYNRQELIRRWREVSYLPEVNSAIREIANEAIVYDDIEDVLSLNLSNIDLPESILDEIQASFQKINYLLDFSEKGDELFRQWYVDGVLNVEVVYDNERIREGIKKLILLSPMNFHQYFDKDTGVKRYTYTNLNQANKNFQTKHEEEKVFKEEQITCINSGEWNINKTFPISNLNPALKTINQLSNIEDTLVINRLTKSIEKRIFGVPIKGIPKPKAEEYIRSLMMNYRQKKIYNTDMGTIENKNRAISILEDFWVPIQADGSRMTIENLPPVAQTFNTFEDVDYFVNKLYKALNVPTNRRMSESRLVQGNQIDIEKEELRFFKFILKLRKKFNNLFVDLLKKDLLARKVLTLSDWVKIQEKIKFVYANSNQYSEIKNNQIISMRIETANSAISLKEAGLMDDYQIMTEILRYTDEDMKAMKERALAAKEEGKSKPEQAPEEDGEDFSSFEAPENENEDIGTDLDQAPEEEMTAETEQPTS